eukprot:7377313-Prymnesium_polylepis.3
MATSRACEAQPTGRSAAAETLGSCVTATRRPFARSSCGALFSRARSTSAPSAPPLVYSAGS